MSAPDNKDAEAEWARMQGLGGVLRKQRMIATVASTAVMSVGFAGSILVFLFWPYERMPVVALGVPIGVMLPLAWAVRSKLWPKGQFR